MQGVKHVCGEDLHDLYDDAPKRNEKGFPKVVSTKLARALALRNEFMGNSGANATACMPDGASRAADVYIGPCPSAVTDALDEIMQICSDCDVNQLCQGRLEWLSANFEIYRIENQGDEFKQTSSNNVGLYNIPQVDTHLHASAMMSPPELMKFMDSVYERDKDRSLGDGKSTVGKLMVDAGYCASTGAEIDAMRVHAHFDMFGDFNAFNAAFSPYGSRDMKNLFFGTDLLDGEYLFRIVETCAKDAERHHLFLEPRFSIYGRKDDEWAKLATWARRWNLPSLRGILLGVQMPRIYPVWRSKGLVSSFGEMLRNFWSPLFQAVARPDAAENADVVWLLNQLRVIDTVDDESKRDAFEIRGLPTPEEWTSDENPSYAYYHYYMYVNLAKLNALRAAASTKTSDGSSRPFLIPLRPHCGEAGPTHHLITAWLFCSGVSHGILLDKEPALQYLYKLAQIPVAVSPMSNAVLFVSYAENPFHRFFKRGLCVTLTTDDPMMFHLTSTPLFEEYSMARTFFSLSACDLAEISRNSCLAAFSADERETLHAKEDTNRTNIPTIRSKFRADMLHHELEQLRIAAAS